jgi:hypothetical protein
VQSTCGHATLTPNIQCSDSDVDEISNILGSKRCVSAWVVPNTLKMTRTPKQQKPLNQWHIITSQNTQILTTTAVVSTVGYVSTEVVSRAQEGSTIAQFSNYSVRVLE